MPFVSATFFPQTPDEKQYRLKQPVSNDLARADHREAKNTHRASGGGQGLSRGQRALEVGA
jgi:hypothetical protein